MDTKNRTSGDGMEQDNWTDFGSPKRIFSNYQKSNSTSSAYNKKAIPKYHVIASKHQIGNRKRVVQLIPKLVDNKKKSKHNFKEPRFVPFEPYKCAINPLTRLKTKNKFKINKNNLDISILVSQMSSMKTLELEKNAKEIEEKSELQLAKEAHSLEIEALKMENNRIENELKFQTQVNSELKNLLVASVGEDLQTRVNFLTEDKLQLAKALLDSANSLSTHTEQIEFLAGQCEVWRSKFLASSVMIEELARWKADLSQKNLLLKNSANNMLQLTTQIREIEIEILKNITFLAGIKDLNLPTNNIIDLTSECLNILQQMVLRSGIGMPDNLKLNNKENLTPAEKLTIDALKESNQPLMSTDDAFKAIIGQAFQKDSSLSINSEVS